MQLNELMTRGVECVTPSDSVARAAAKMRDLDVGSLPVCGENDRLIGMITDRDITIRATANACDPTETPVSEAMSPEVVYCFEDQDMYEAADIMESRQIRRLAVLNRNKRLVGIVSLGDLAVKANDKDLSHEALEQISEPAAPVR